MKIGINFRCEIYKLPAKVGATIEIRTRLWNSTLAEDYRDVDLVEIYSKARVVVDADISQVTRPEAVFFVVCDPSMNEL